MASKAPSKVDALRQMREANAKAVEAVAKQKQAAPMSDKEEGLLAELEGNVERGREVFTLVLASLSQIRDKRLYRAKYATFEDYCRKRWDFGAPRVRQLLAAESVVKEIAATDTTVSLPPNERVARELAPVPEGERAAAWQEAQKIASEAGEKPAAKHAREARKKYTPIADRNKRKKKPPTPPPSTATTGDTVAGLGGQGGGIHEGSGESAATPSRTTSTGDDPGPDTPTTEQQHEGGEAPGPEVLAADVTTGGPAQQVVSHAGGPASDSTAGSPDPTSPAGEAVEPTSEDGGPGVAPAPAGDLGPEVVDPEEWVVHEYVDWIDMLPGLAVVGDEAVRRVLGIVGTDPYLESSMMAKAKQARDFLDRLLAEYENREGA